MRENISIKMKINTLNMRFTHLLECISLLKNLFHFIEILDTFILDKSKLQTLKFSAVKSCKCICTFLMKSHI